MRLPNNLAKNSKRASVLPEVEDRIGSIILLIAYKSTFLYRDEINEKAHNNSRYIAINNNALSEIESDWESVTS